jgi:hypothetical protein
LNRNYPSNPALQPIKGIFVFYPADELADKAQALLKTLSCQVLSSHDNRFTVKTGRGNLQAIKQRWMDNNPNNVLSQQLHASLSQIIIGGTAK